MIRRLQKKFITISTVVFIVIIGSFFVIANLINYISINRKANVIMDILVRNNGTMPIINVGFGDQMISPETSFETRYFTVSIINNDKIIVNVDKIAAINRATAEEYALKLYGKDKDHGYMKTYKYQKINIKDGVMYIFLDCSRDLGNFKNFLLYSSIVYFITIVSSFILIVICSDKAIEPFIENYDKQKRFITDANHEIKTPLSIIKASNEVLELEYGKNEWIDSINEQIVRLTSLTEKLIFLSRMDEDNMKMQMSLFSLSNTTIEVVSSFASIAKIKNKEFETQIEPNIEIYGDVSLIGQLIAILLDNAFKYSSENGKIMVSLFEKNKSKILIVKNSVDVVEIGNLNKFFDRFYRSDLSRNTDVGGFGIGLSVAEAIAKLHKAKISAKSDDGKSVELKVIF